MTAYDAKTKEQQIALDNEFVKLQNEIEELTHKKAELFKLYRSEPKVLREKAQEIQALINKKRSCVDYILSLKIEA